MAIDKSSAERLAAIRAEISAARDHRKECRDAQRVAAEDVRNASPRSGEKITEMVEFRAAQRAKDRLTRAEDNLEDLQEQEREALAEMGDNTPARGDSESFLADPAVLQQLSAMASSKMPIGRVALGTAIGRDRMLDAIGGRISAATGFTEISDPSRKGAPRGIVPELRRPTRLLDLIPSAPMEGLSFEYVQTLAPPATGGPAEVAEGAVKPSTEVLFEDETAYAETVAVWTKLKKQAVEDESTLQGIVTGTLAYRLLRHIESQILNGAGHDSGQIQGILTMPGIGDVAYDAAELKADAVLDGITDVLLSDATPNFVALNPLDWRDMLKAKASGDGHYFSPGAFGAIASQLWEIPVVPTAAIPVGEALVGDALIGATVLVRSGVTGYVSDADSNDFTANRLTILVEGRYGCAVWYPQAFARVHFTP